MSRTLRQLVARSILEQNGRSLLDDRPRDAVLRFRSCDLSRYARPNIRARKCIGLTYQVVKQTVNQLSGIKLNRANNSRCRIPRTTLDPLSRRVFPLFQSAYSHSLSLSLPSAFSVPFSPVFLNKISRGRSRIVKIVPAGMRPVDAIYFARHKFGRRLTVHARASELPLEVI